MTSPRHRLSVAFATLAVLAVVTLLAAVVGWRAEGGRWYVVASPSMGTATPVGTLLLTRPTSVAQAHVGDIITFRSPGSGKIYSHRVAAKTSAGLQTRGDVNPVVDSWTLHDADLIGRVAHHVRGAGFLIRGLPLFLAILGVVWLLTSRMRPSRRGAGRLLGVSSSLAVVSYLIRPWVGLQQLGQSPPPDGAPGVVMQVISTGLMPTRVTGVGNDTSVALVDGAVGSLHLTKPSANGAYLVASSLDLTLWWWVGMALVVVAPLLWALLIGLEPKDRFPPTRKHARVGPTVDPPTGDRAHTGRRAPARGPRPVPVGRAATRARPGEYVTIGSLLR